MQVPPSHVLLARSMAARSGRAPLARVAPEYDQGSNGRIEGALSGRCNRDSVLEHGEEIWTHDRPRCPGAAEAAELAVRTIVAHHPVELSNARESGGGGQSCLVFRRRVAANPDRHAHVDLGELVR